MENRVLTTRIQQDNIHSSGTVPDSIKTFNPTKLMSIFRLPPFDAAEFWNLYNQFMQSDRMEITDLQALEDQVKDYQRNGDLFELTDPSRGYTAVVGLVCITACNYDNDVNGIPRHVRTGSVGVIHPVEKLVYWVTADRPFCMTKEGVRKITGVHLPLFNQIAINRLTMKYFETQMTRANSLILKVSHGDNPIHC